jgi:phage gp29-like protein
MLFVHSLEYYANYFDSIVQNKVIRDIVDLNWGKETPAPTLKHEKVGDDNVQLFSDALQKLFQSGVITPTLSTEKFIRDMLKMPALSEQEEKEWEKPEPQTNTAVNTAVAPKEKTNEQKASEILENAKKMNDKIDKILG